MITYLQSAFWYLGIALEFAIYFLAMRPASRSRYPAFCTYIGIVASSDVLLLLVMQRHGYETYFWCYWMAQLAQASALVWVIAEVFFDLFRTVPQYSRALFGATTALVSCGAAGAFLFPSLQADQVLSVAQTIDRSTSTGAAIAAWLVVLFANHVGMPWQSKTYGIAAGLSFFLTLQAVVTAVVPHVNGSLRPSVYLVGTIGTFTAEGIWAWYFFQPERPARTWTGKKVETASRVMLEAVESSNESNGDASLRHATY